MKYAYFFSIDNGQLNFLYFLNDINKQSAKSTVLLWHPDLKDKIITIFIYKILK